MKIIVECKSCRGKWSVTVIGGNEKDIPQKCGMCGGVLVVVQEKAQGTPADASIKGKPNA